MKKFCILPVVAALAFFVSCEKPQSEDEKKAEVERQVQQRLATEHQVDDQQRLAQQQADLVAREKALAEKEARTSRQKEATPDLPRAKAVARDTSEKRSSGSYGTFYRKLEPYGAWRETSDYGYVFQPRESQRSSDWRPYTDGRWAYTDAGWTWVSEEPFGWATYHYGRWLRLRKVGWVWVPGEEWAPAWVSWRTSNQYVGWAPLPPEAHFDRGRGIHNWADNYYDIGPEQYSFVPSNELGSQRIQRAVVPTERNVTIVNETTNVTNITYNNTTIVNQGPNYEELRSQSAQPIERYRLERRSEMTSETSQPIVRGEVIEMSAPVIRGERVMERPPTLGETLTQAVVDTGWAIADRSAAERARAKMKSEATPPPNAPLKRFVKPENVSTSAVTAVATATPIATPTAAPKPIATPVPLESVPPEKIVTPQPTVDRAAQLEEQRRAGETKRAAQQAQKAEGEKANAQKMMEQSRFREAQKAERMRQMEEQRKTRAQQAAPTARPEASSPPAEIPATPPPPAQATPPPALVPVPDGTPEQAPKPAPVSTPVATPAEASTPTPPVADDQRKPKNKKQKRPSQDDDSTSEPTPAGSAAPD
ncbi:MAG: DUF6600 domain-containing protein [Verrucomicrobiota bacterium]